jgi:hypothetical protein
MLLELGVCVGGCVGGWGWGLLLPFARGLDPFPDPRRPGRGSAAARPRAPLARMRPVSQHQPRFGACAALGLPASHAGGHEF